MNSWTISPRLFRYLKQRVVLCNNIQFQMVVTMKRTGSSDQALTLTSALNVEQCDQLERMMELDTNATVVFENL